MQRSVVPSPPHPTPTSSTQRNDIHGNPKHNNLHFTRHHPISLRLEARQQLSEGEQQSTSKVNGGEDGNGLEATEVGICEVGTQEGGEVTCTLPDGDLGGERERGGVGWGDT